MQSNVGSNAFQSKQLRVGPYPILAKFHMKLRTGLLLLYFDFRAICCGAGASQFASTLELPKLEAVKVPFFPCEGDHSMLPKSTECAGGASYPELEPEEALDDALEVSDSFETARSSRSSGSIA